MTKTYDVWRARINGARHPFNTGTVPLSKGQIQMLYNTVYPLAQFGERWGRQTALTQEEAVGLVTMIETAAVDDGLSITPEQTEQGRRWLQKYAKRYGLPFDDD